MKTRVLTINGKEMARFAVETSTPVDVTEDNSHGWESLKEYAVEWHVGDKVYEGKISHAEYQRMVADGVMK